MRSKGRSKKHIISPRIPRYRRTRMESPKKYANNESRSIMERDGCAVSIAIPSSWEKSVWKGEVLAEFEHLDFPEMKGPRDCGHADHASVSSESSGSLPDRGNPPRPGSEIRFTKPAGGFQIRPTCYPRDRHARYRLAIHPLAYVQRVNRCVH